MQGKAHGFWIQRFPSGAVMEAELVHGVWHGFHRWIEPDGRIMEGRNVNGNRHGYWMERTKDKRLLWEAEYVDGKKKWERRESE